MNGGVRYHIGLKLLDPASRHAKKINDPQQSLKYLLALFLVDDIFF